MDSGRALIEVLRPLVSESRQASRTAATLAPDPRVGSVVTGRSPWRQAIRRVMVATLPSRLFLVHGALESNCVCLTFDDGPHPEHTPRILDALRERGVHATFFVIGELAERYPHIVRRAAAEGHAIGNHTFYHHEPGLASARELQTEILLTRRVLAGILGTPSELFRPPKGKLTIAKSCRAWLAGQTIVLWNVDSKDYACKSAAELRTRLREHPLCSGDLVLMHDRLACLAGSLPSIIDEARNRGLEFATVLQWAGRHSRSNRVGASDGLVPAVG